MSIIHIRIILSFSLFFGYLSAYAGDRFLPFHSVMDFGAVGDGETMNTDAIREAIEFCNKKGGGTIYFPPGNYLSGPIVFKSNISLHIEAGAVILASTNFDDYPDTETRSGGVEVIGHCPFIFGKDLKNITIKGRGTIDGQGSSWWKRSFFLRDNKNAELTQREKHFLRINEGKGGPFIRPCLIQFINCENILIEGVTLTNSPHWTINPVYCNNVTIDGITILNPHDSKNTDGINPDSCTNVRISNCYISTGDDCIAIKSGRNEDGRRVGRPSENITITNCTMLHGHGGVVIGSEMSGDVRNVVVSNCVFKGTKRGIRFKTQRGRGGVIENISFNNIIMEDVLQGAIIVDMVYYDRENIPQPIDETTPVIRNIFISNVIGHNVHEAFTIHGIEESPARNIRLNNVYLSAKTPGRIQHVDGLLIKDSHLINQGSTALMISGVRAADLSHFNIVNHDQRIPLLDMENVDGFAYSGVQIPASGAAPFILRGPVRNILIESGKKKLSLDQLISGEAGINHNLKIRKD